MRPVSTHSKDLAVMSSNYLARTPVPTRASTGDRRHQLPRSAQQTGYHGPFVSQPKSPLPPVRCLMGKILQALPKER
jgi:hypothetical protein